MKADIASARTDVPALVAEVRRLQAREKEAEALVRRSVKFIAPQHLSVANEMNAFLRGGEKR